MKSSAFDYIKPRKNIFASVCTNQHIGGFWDDQFNHMLTSHLWSWENVEIFVFEGLIKNMSKINYEHANYKLLLKACLKYTCKNINYAIK